MRGFYTIFQLIILAVLIGNPALYYFYGDLFYTLPDKEKFYVLGGIIFAEFLVIILFIKALFHDPIIKLEFIIKSFMIGDLKDKKIEFKKTLNPHLNYALSFFARTLHTLKNIKEEFIHGKEIKGEVELGKEIQGKMLTKKLTKVPELDIIVKSKPAGEIGGDSYDIIQQDENYYIYVGDATGHGVGAGFIMIMVNALISGFTKLFKSGADILTKTNEILKPRVKANLLMSLLMVRWDSENRRAFMTGAGHEYLMIYKHAQNKTYRIKSGGVALGMIKDISKLIKEQEIQFQENDVIILYSDGITEAINKQKKDGSEEMFGETRLEKAIESAPYVSDRGYKSARSIFNNITIELSKFMGYRHAQLDDVTLAVIHYKGGDYDNKNDFPEQIAEEFITEWNW